MVTEIQCILCEEYKQKSLTFWNNEHIVAYGFGNDGQTDALLKHKICNGCNSSLGRSIVEPFLIHVKSREIEYTYGMKRRNKVNKLRVSGSGIIVMYETSVAHLFECIRISFETHIKFLNHEYRDVVFHELRKLLLNVMGEYDHAHISYKERKLSGRDFCKFWAETGQTGIAAKNFKIISDHIYRLDAVINNSTDVIAEIEARSRSRSYASLIQLCCMKTGIFVLVCLQSLPALAVRVSLEVDRYIKEFEQDGVHVIDLRSSEKWVGFEKIMH